MVDYSSSFRKRKRTISVTIIERRFKNPKSKKKENIFVIFCYTTPKRKEKAVQKEACKNYLTYIAKKLWSIVKNGNRTKMVEYINKASRFKNSPAREETRSEFLLGPKLTVPWLKFSSHERKFCHVHSSWDSSPFPRAKRFVRRERKPKVGGGLNSSNLTNPSEGVSWRITGTAGNAGA